MRLLYTRTVKISDKNMYFSLSNSSKELRNGEELIEVANDIIFRCENYCLHVTISLYSLSRNEASDETISVGGHGSAYL